eukprot:jgi/Mesvir1/28499/Mv15911-RA.1
MSNTGPSPAHAGDTQAVFAGTSGRQQALSVNAPESLQATLIQPYSKRPLLGKGGISSLVEGIVDRNRLKVADTPLQVCNGGINPWQNRPVLNPVHGFVMTRETSFCADGFELSARGGGKVKIRVDPRLDATLEQGAVAHMAARNRSVIKAPVQRWTEEDCWQRSTTDWVLPQADMDRHEVRHTAAAVSGHGTASRGHPPRVTTSLDHTMHMRDGSESTSLHGSITHGTGRFPAASPGALAARIRARGGHDAGMTIPTGHGAAVMGRRISNHVLVRQKGSPQTMSPAIRRMAPADRSGGVGLRPCELAEAAAAAAAAAHPPGGGKSMWGPAGPTEGSTSFGSEYVCDTPSRLAVPALRLAPGTSQVAGQASVGAQVGPLQGSFSAIATPLAQADALQAEVRAGKGGTAQVPATGASQAMREAGARHGDLQGAANEALSGRQQGRVEEPSPSGSTASVQSAGQQLPPPPPPPQQQAAQLAEVPAPVMEVRPVKQGSDARGGGFGIGRWRVQDVGGSGGAAMHVPAPLVVDRQDSGADGFRVGSGFIEVDASDLSSLGSANPAGRLDRARLQGQVSQEVLGGSDVSSLSPSSEEASPRVASPLARRMGSRGGTGGKGKRTAPSPLAATDSTDVDVSGHVALGGLHSRGGPTLRPPKGGPTIQADLSSPDPMQRGRSSTATQPAAGTAKRMLFARDGAPSGVASSSIGQQRDPRARAATAFSGRATPAGSLPASVPVVASADNASTSAPAGGRLAASDVGPSIPANATGSPHPYDALLAAAQWDHAVAWSCRSLLEHAFHGWRGWRHARARHRAVTRHRAARLQRGAFQWLAAWTARRATMRRLAETVSGEWARALLRGTLRWWRHYTGLCRVRRAARGPRAGGGRMGALDRGAGDKGVGAGYSSGVRLPNGGGGGRVHGVVDPWASDSTQGPSAAATPRGTDDEGGGGGGVMAASPYGSSPGWGVHARRVPGRGPPVVSGDAGGSRQVDATGQGRGVWWGCREPRFHAA